MKKNQWKDMITCVRLIKYGMSAKQCFGTMLLFMVIGIAFELMIVLGRGVGERYIGLQVDFGALFLYAAAMYPSQILMTLDISGMVQASPYKKRIQTSAMSFCSLCSNLVMLAIILLVRALGACLMPQRAAWIWASLPVIGIMGLGLSIMGALMYKFYILSVILLAVVVGGGANYMGYRSVMVADNTSGILGGAPLPVAIMFCIAALFVGNGTQYLIARMIYKRPFSKGAFGNAVGKKFI
ncbi:MAG: hypothetical protein NC420_12715 [Eubacterium sp.]|nr:hypothetical protein [Eubacterium sp.]